MIELDKWTKIIFHGNLVPKKATTKGITNWSLLEYTIARSSMWPDESPFSGEFINCYSHSKRKHITKNKIKIKILIKLFSSSKPPRREAAETKKKT